MDEQNTVEEVSIENVVTSLGLMVDRANQITSPYSDDLEKKVASLMALRDSLLRCFPVPEGGEAEQSDSGSVLFALNSETQDWSRHGFTGKDWRGWQVYGFSAQSAGDWKKIGVDIEKALFFRDSGLHADMYVKWVNLHDFGDFDDPVTQNSMFHLVGVVRAMKEVTIAGAHRWVERDINLWDMPKWIRAGYTPAKAQAAIDSGMDIADLAGVDDVLVPGASWSKVQKAMDKYGWKFKNSTQNRWSITVEWEKGNNGMSVAFTHGGRVWSFYLWVPSENSGAKTRLWIPHYGYRGVKNLLALLKDEHEGKIEQTRRQ